MGHGNEYLTRGRKKYKTTHLVPEQRRALGEKEKRKKKKEKVKKKKKKVRS